MRHAGLATAQKGELALLRVLQRAVEMGWIAGRQTCNCDGAVSLDFTKGGKRDRTYPDHEVDAVLAYVAPADAMVWLHREHFHGRRAIQLRYAPPRSGQRHGCLFVAELIW